MRQQIVRFVSKVGACTRLFLRKKVFSNLKMTLARLFVLFFSSLWWERKKMRLLCPRFHTKVIRWVFEHEHTHIVPLDFIAWESQRNNILLGLFHTTPKRHTRSGIFILRRSPTLILPASYLKPLNRATNTRECARHCTAVCVLEAHKSNTRDVLEYYSSRVASELPASEFRAMKAPSGILIAMETCRCRIDLVARSHP